MSSKKIFSLIEIIVVIVILAILTYVATINVIDFLKRGQDAKRMGDINMIASALQTYLYKNNEYPLPDDYLEIKYGTSTIQYQGYIGSKCIKQLVDLKSEPKDPVDNNYYTYSISYDKNKYQLLIYKELISYSPSSFSNITRASDIDYISRYINTIGDKVGIILKLSTLAPIQTVLTGMNLATYRNNIKTYFTNDYYSLDTGQKLLSEMGAYRSNLTAYDQSLGLYLNNENIDDNILYDQSQYRRNGVLYNGVKQVEGILTKGLFFDGQDDLLKISDSTNSSLDLTGRMTIAFSIYPMTNTGKTVILLDKTNNTYKIILDTNGNIKGYFNTTSVSTASTNKKWENYTLTYDGSTLKLYKNGTLMNSASVSTTIGSNNQDLIIGSGYNGILDEIRIYKRSFTDSEVLFLYNSLK